MRDVDLERWAVGGSAQADLADFEKELEEPPTQAVELDRERIKEELNVRPKHA